MEFGVWSLEFGVWSLEFGVWSLEFGVWNKMEPGKINKDFLFSAKQCHAYRNQ